MSLLGSFILKIINNNILEFHFFEKCIFLEIMMYTINIQELNLKYIIL
jgi:hypothetical protein